MRTQRALLLLCITGCHHEQPLDNHEQVDASPAPDQALAADATPVPTIVTIAPQEQGPVALALGADRLYWTTRGGSLRTVPTAGGSAMTLASPLDYPWLSSGWAVAANGDTPYWTSGSGRKIYSIEVPGGPPKILLQDQAFPSSVAIDDGWLYWVGYDRKLKRAGLDGTGNTTLAETIGLYPMGLVAQDDHLYWLDGPHVKMVPATGGEPTAIVTESYAIYTLATDKTHVYWSTTTVGSSHSGTIKRASLRGQGPELVASHLEKVKALAVDGNALFWVDEVGQVQTLDLGDPTAQPVTLATGQAHPSDIAVDASFVYWLNAGTGPAYADGAIVRLAR